jgi:hypothetical protein
MTSLPPLIESSSSERARELLQAARADRPRSSAAQRTLAALGVVGSTATAAGAALGSAGAHAGASVTASAVAGLPLVAVKWLVVGTLSGLALASGATLVFSGREAVDATHPATVAAPASSRQGTQPEPPYTAPAPTAALAEAEPATERAEAPAPPLKASKPSSATPKGDSAAPLAAPSQAAFEAPEQSKLLHDVALLDDVRHALQAGDSARALSLVARYEQERQTHVLDREAEVLRQRALTLGSK